MLAFQRLGGEFVFSNFNDMANTWGQNVIVVQVAFDLKRQALVVDVLNYCHTTVEIWLDLEATGFRPVNGEATTLYAPSLAAHNAHRDPDAIQQTISALTFGDTPDISVEVLPYSVNHILLR